jgi:tight adherence protein C
MPAAPVALVAAATLSMSVALTVMAAGGAFSGRSSGDRALAALAQYRSVGARTDAPAASARDRLLVPALDALRRLAVRISPSGTAVSLQRRLDVAGNPATWTVERLLAVKGMGLVLLGGVAAMLGSRVGPGTVGVLGVLSGAAGFFLPDLLLYNVGAKRQTQIRSGLSDVLDMMTVCVEAGLGFDAALRQVARNGKGPMAAELVRVLQEMQIGKGRAQALRALADRTTVRELKQVVSALVQADSLGIPVAGVLREQSKEMRVKRRQLAEEKAQQVPVKILLPMIFLIFPSLFVIILGPAAISIGKDFIG